ncbi:mevalonate kinase [Candidatus Bathyarchaeota archaeon]|nr:mevalonate kinase [Candidatus Bathyarchaeota archaeon]
MLVVKVSASAPGKVILFGEHFVVYDEPAVVMAVNLRANVSVEEVQERGVHVESQDLSVSGTFIKDSFAPKIGGMNTRTILEPIYLAVKAVSKQRRLKGGLYVNVKSEIPIAAGLGSSAAVAVATVAAVAKVLEIDLSREEISQLAYGAEEYVHGKPSGVDQTISAFGGLITYRRTQGFSPLKISTSIPIVIGNTGQKRSTGELVSLVRERREEFPEVMNPIIRAGGNLTLSAIEALRKGDLHSLGELMNVNHGLLSSIGVSNEMLDRLVNAARNAGALGSKLTGAGGGGCMIALADRSKIGKVTEAIGKAGGIALRAYEFTKGVETCLI